MWKCLETVGLLLIPAGMMRAVFALLRYYVALEVMHPLGFSTPPAARP